MGQSAPKPDLNPAYNLIARNFFIGNYGASMAIDNDGDLARSRPRDALAKLTRACCADGSSYYKIQNNFEVYGGHKSNFGGHNKLRSDALIPYSKVYQEGLCCRVNSQAHDPEHTDGYFNNTCIQSAANLTAYTFRYCNPKNIDNQTNLLHPLRNNRIYNPDGKMTVLCGETQLSEEQFQQSGADPGTTVGVTPSDAVVIGWAKALLEPLTPPGTAPPLGL